MSKTTNWFSREVHACALRAILDYQDVYPSRWLAAISDAKKIGRVPQTLDERAKKAEVDSGQQVAQRPGPLCLPVRAKREPVLRPEIVCVFAKNCAAYGARMVWRRMSRDGFAIARCTVGRPMRDMGLAGAIRRKPVRIMFSDKVAPCLLDRVNWQSHAPAPNRLWPADITYIATGKRWRYFASVLVLAAH